MSLTRHAILEAPDIETREVAVPEWHGTVLLRALTGAQRDAWESSMRVQRGREMVQDTGNARAKLVVKAIVDENGDRLFRDQDAGALGAKSGAVLDRLFDIVAEMSGISDTAVADAEGNSEPGPSGDSSSDSPENSGAPSPNS